MATIEQIARVCHQVNRAYCEALGDTSQPVWEDAEDWQKESAILGVKAVMTHPGGTPQDSHANWLKHKETEGWVYGPKKDPVTKQHPCMVPYEQLPVEQRVKDYLFIAVVRALDV